MPIDYKKYDPNWKTEIRPRILERANHCCEQCGVANYAYGARDLRGEWHDEMSIHRMNAGEGDVKFGEFPDMIKIVLTIAHLNHDITDNRDENLSALCQRCHLNHDRDHHKVNARKTRINNKKEKIKSTGQMEMFE